MNLGTITHLKEKLAERKAKALLDAIHREQRTRVLQVLLDHVPRQENLKQRQETITRIADEVMDIFNEQPAAKE